MVLRAIKTLEAYRIRASGQARIGDGRGRLLPGAYCWRARGHAMLGRGNYHQGGGRVGHGSYCQIVTPETLPPETWVKLPRRFDMGQIVK